jgi:rhamnosyltransferase
MANADWASSRMKLSIVIRCRNECRSLSIVFQALKAQRCDFSWEVVVVDNESDDDTAELCRANGARIVSINKADFTYGRALNLGVRESKGELVLLLSSHSLPIGSHFLDQATQPFSDRNIAAARCLMIGNSDQISSWFQPRVLHYQNSEEQQKAESGSKWLGDYPTAGCCVLRRSVWEEVAFDETLEANEDKHWASKVLARGYSIYCCSEAVWLYTRKRSKAAERNRRMREHLSLYRITGRPPMSLTSFLGLSLRSCVAAPWVAIRHILDNLHWNSILVSIPLRAKKSAQAGSFREFNTRH